MRRDAHATNPPPPLQRVPAATHGRQGRYFGFPYHYTLTSESALRWRTRIDRGTGRRDLRRRIPATRLSQFPHPHGLETGGDGRYQAIGARAPARIPRTGCCTSRALIRTSMAPVHPWRGVRQCGAKSSPLRHASRRGITTNDLRHPPTTGQTRTFGPRRSLATTDCPLLRRYQLERVDGLLRAQPGGRPLLDQFALTDGAPLNQDDSPRLSSPVPAGPSPAYLRVIHLPPDWFALDDTPAGSGVSRNGSGLLRATPNTAA